MSNGSEAITLGTLARVEALEEGRATLLIVRPLRPQLGEVLTNVVTARRLAFFMSLWRLIEVEPVVGVALQWFCRGRNGRRLEPGLLARAVEDFPIDPTAISD